MFRTLVALLVLLPAMAEARSTLKDFAEQVIAKY